MKLKNTVGVVIGTLAAAASFGALAQGQGAFEVEGFAKKLQPLRNMLKVQPFIGGEGPLFPDYIVFGALQWLRTTAGTKVLEADDPVYAWREKLLDAFGGMARQSPGHPV